MALLSLVLVAVYPTMKRFTYWPQVVLGLAFNWGALVGYAAVTGTLSWAAVALYVGGVAWTLVYDTIYAMQDQRDDAIIGVRSTARRFAAAPRRWLSLFAVLAVLAWALAGYLASLGPYYFGFVLVIALHFGWQIALLKPHDPADCLAKFKANAGVGILLTVAVIAGHCRLMARLPADPEGFIRANTALEAPAMVPEFKLWLASEYVPIWQATEAWLEEQNIDPPYWAFCWPGGQAIARYLLDNPEQVRGKRVIDFAAGSGVSSMAAARAGAASVLANDIDALSLVAAQLNAKANGLSFAISVEDWLAGPDGAPAADVVIAGDVCYERDMSARALAWLRSHARLGRLVLLGDPGRNYFSAQGLSERARYEIPTSLQLENRGMRETVVWQVLPHP